MNSYEEEPKNLKTDTGVVHLEYEIDSPPGPPPRLQGTQSWTRFVCISDTHSGVFPVPPGDVLLHSGDLTQTGKYEDFRVTMDWICSLPHPIKIIIAGNHDLPLHRDWYETNWSRFHTVKQNVNPMLEFLTGPQAKKAGVVYLQDQSYEFRTRPNGRTWSVYGSPWSPWFHDWAFNYNRGEEAEALISRVPQTDILLTHGPPYGVLDETIGGDYAGCEALEARLPVLRPRLHVFGHIHEAHGAVVKHWGQNGGCSILVNAANWPMGHRARQNAPGVVAMGAAPFQPVIVDLLDEP